jgi:hypothetical protein
LPCAFPCLSRQPKLERYWLMIAASTPNMLRVRSIHKAMASSIVFSCSFPALHFACELRRSQDRSPSACRQRFSELLRSLVCSTSSAAAPYSCDARKSTSGRSKRCDPVRRRVCRMRDDGCKSGLCREDS